MSASLRVIESKKYWLPVLLVIMLAGVTALSGCVSNDEEEEPETPPPTGSNVVEIQMTAKQWSFEPNEITVTEGDFVRLIITSTMDEESQYSDHSFSLNAYDIAVVLPKGKTTTVEFTADKVGEFRFDCSIFCGARHNDMVGSLIVKAKTAETVVEKPQLGNHTALEVSSEIYVNGGTPDWENENLMLVVERENESVAFVDTSRNLVVGRVHGLGFQPHTVVFDEQARYGYLISRGGWLSKIDLNDLSVVKYVKVGESSRGTALSANGNWILTSNYDPSSFVVVNTQTMEVEMNYQIPIRWTDGEPQFSRVASLLDTPNGYVFAAMKDLGEVWVIDVDETRWDESPFPVVKVFNEAGGLLHDAFITPDGKYYMLASQSSDHMLVIDVETLEEVTKVPTGQKPHPGPGAVWGDYAFSPSIGEGKLNVWNITTWELDHVVEVGGPALFVRTYKFGDDGNYPYVWWDTVLSQDTEQNKEVYVLDARLLATAHDNASLAAATQVLKYDPSNGRTLHPEFSFDGKYVYISNWEENGSLLVYEAFPDSGMTPYDGGTNDPAKFDLIAVIEGLTTPTGTFQVGLRAEEIGV